MKEKLEISLCNKFFFISNSKLYWKVSPSRKVRKGSEVGSIKDNGYLRTSLKGNHFLVHRIMFLIYNGYLPEYVDHRDGNKLNNSEKNLRAASSSQNNYNAKIGINNNSGIKGVNWDEKRKKWRARITVKGKELHVGYFGDMGFAREEIERVREELHGEFCNHGNRG